MKLPNNQDAIIPYEKISGYLLSATHRDGRHKAAFFTRFGFSLDSWTILAESLLRHVADHDVNKIEESAFGTRYIIEGIMFAPDGRLPYVRSIWFVEKGEKLPRFVTAYLVRRKQND